MALRHFAILTFAIFVFAIPVLAQTRELPRYLEHTVRDRETPSSIANDYNLKLKTFLMLNNFPEDVKLKPGQVVLIRQLESWEKQVREKGYVSKDKDEDEPAPVKKTETAFVKTEKPKPAAKTEATTAPATDKPVHAAAPVSGNLYEKSGGDTHVVQRGQTFYRIALTYGLTVDQLKKLNNMSNTDIKVGQALKIR
jgi:peptidoglycan endopeptidase LytF